MEKAEKQSVLEVMKNKLQLADAYIRITLPAIKRLFTFLLRKKNPDYEKWIGQRQEALRKWIQILREQYEVLLDSEHFTKYLEESYQFALAELPMEFEIYSEHYDIRSQEEYVKKVRNDIEISLRHIEEKLKLADYTDIENFPGTTKFLHFFFMWARLPIQVLFNQGILMIVVQ